MNARLFIDADNTLWDTDAVFANAQITLAKSIAKLAERVVHGDDHVILSDTRAIDQEIASEHPRGLRYPPVLLAQKLHQSFGGDGDHEALNGAVATYIENLNLKPTLRPGVQVAIPMLTARIGLLTIVSEGSFDRCQALLEFHALSRYFSSVISEKKTPELYAGLRDLRFQDVMVGDQLDRDIGFSQSAGFVGVLYRGGFAPFWTASIQEQPSYTITDFRQLLQVI